MDKQKVMQVSAEEPPGPGLYYIYFTAYGEISVIITIVTIYVSTINYQ